MTNDLHPFERADALTEQELRDVSMEVAVKLHSAKWIPSGVLPGLYEILASYIDEGYPALAVRKVASDGNRVIVENNVPHFASDLNEAIKLAKTVDGTFHLQSSAPNAWLAWFHTRDDLINGVPRGEAVIPALAICRAWLIWRSQQD